MLRVSRASGHFVLSVSRCRSDCISTVRKLSSSQPSGNDGTLKNPESAPLSSENIRDDRNEDSSSIIFPWRSEAIPIHRIIEGTLEHAKKGHLLSTTSMKPGDSTLNELSTAYMCLQVPWYQFLFFGAWKSELADSISWAFTQGVANILSSFSKGKSTSVSSELT